MMVAKMCTCFSDVRVIKSRYTRNFFIKKPATGNSDQLTKNGEVNEKLLSMDQNGSWHYFPKIQSL